MCWRITGEVGNGEEVPMSPAILGDRQVRLLWGSNETSYSMVTDAQEGSPLSFKSKCPTPICMESTDAVVAMIRHAS
jgi:hypothetical protein